MERDRSVIEDVLDYGVYAPIGLVIEVTSDLPHLVSTGRTRVEGQLRMARSVGEFAVMLARKRVEQLIETQMPGGRGTPGPVLIGGGPTAPAAEKSSSGSGRPADFSATPTGADPTGASPSRPDSLLPLTPRIEDLAIPGYDALAASQVVQRLASLTGEELEEVRLYETANRHRRTVLSRIDQLRHGRA